MPRDRVFRTLIMVEMRPPRPPTPDEAGGSEGELHEDYRDSHRNEKRMQREFLVALPAENLPARSQSSCVLALGKGQGSSARRRTTACWRAVACIVQHVARANRCEPVQHGGTHAKGAVDSITSTWTGQHRVAVASQPPPSLSGSSRVPPPISLDLTRDRGQRRPSTPPFNGTLTLMRAGAVLVPPSPHHTTPHHNLCTTLDGRPPMYAWYT